MCERCEQGDCTTCTCKPGERVLAREHDDWVGTQPDSD
jgi:hypothetical protein